eukprot:90475_1
MLSLAKLAKYKIHEFTIVLKTFNKRHWIVRSSFASSAMEKHFKQKLSGTYKQQIVLTSPQNSAITIHGSKGNVINFCSNNYLGLSNDIQLIVAAKQGLDLHGLGLSSGRVISGTHDIHLQLERTIAQFHDKDEAILYATCYDANIGIFDALLQTYDCIISDELNHASIIDGVRLSKASRYIYEHMNMKSLEENLQKANDDGCRHKLIVTEGSFSMDGDIAPLKDIVKLSNMYDAHTMIDECHSTGVLGKTGRGTEEYCGTKVDIINSTFSKALGGAMGGYTTASKTIIDTLRQKSRPYLFSNALMPSVVTATSKAFDLLMNDTTYRGPIMKRLEDNTKQFRSKMKSAGFELMGSDDHPICPVVFGDAQLTEKIADDMLDHAIYVVGFSFPVVPRNKARIRVQVSAAHTNEQIDQCVEAFRVVASENKVFS